MNFKQLNETTLSKTPKACKSMGELCKACPDLGTSVRLSLSLPTKVERYSECMQTKGQTSWNPVISQLNDQFRSHSFF